MNKEKYLPLGSIVLLKGEDKRFMITGFALKSKNEIYDYSGCLYPEGIMFSDSTILFNHNEIEKVFHTGYVNDEWNDFNKKINKIVQEVSKADDVQDIELFDTLPK